MKIFKTFAINDPKNFCTSDFKKIVYMEKCIPRRVLTNLSRPDFYKFRNKSSSSECSVTSFPRRFRFPNAIELTAERRNKASRISRKQFPKEIPILSNLSVLYSHHFKMNVPRPRVAQRYREQFRLECNQSQFTRRERNSVVTLVRVILSSMYRAKRARSLSRTSHD